MAFHNPEQPASSRASSTVTQYSIEQLDAFMAAEELLGDLQSARNTVHNTPFTNMQMKGIYRKNKLCPNGELMGKELSFLFRSWTDRSNPSCNLASAAFTMSLGMTVHTGLLSAEYADFTSDITAMREPSFDFGAFGRLYMDDLQESNATTYYYYKRLYDIGKNFLGANTRPEENVFRAAFILPYVFTVATNLIEQWQSVDGIENDPGLAAYLGHRYEGALPPAGEYDARLHTQLLADYHDLGSKAAPLSAVHRPIPGGHQ